MSTAMVGRILSYLKARGVLKEPPRNGISTRKGYGGVLRCAQA